MRKHAIQWALGVASCLLLTTWIVGAAAKPATPATQNAGALSIDHKPVACIVAEEHPQLNACFAPADNLARGRVFFRAGGTPHWYFVEMKPAQRCFVGTLLKPKKSMIGKDVDLYVEAVAKNLESGRTPEYAAKVVASASECRHDLPVAAWVPKASVTVGAEAGAAAVPPGFAAAGLVGGGGGISATAITFGAIGGAGAITGLAVALSSGSSSTPTPTATPTPTPTPTPSPTPIPFKAVFTVSPNPPKGPGPLTVTFDMCQSTGINLTYKVEFDVTRGGDVSQGPCHVSTVYHGNPPPPPTGKFPPPPDISYNFLMTVTDVGRTPPQSAQSGGTAVVSEEF